MKACMIEVWDDVGRYHYLKRIEYHGVVYVYPRHMSEQEKVLVTWRACAWDGYTPKGFLCRVRIGSHSMALLAGFMAG